MNQAPSDAASPPELPVDTALSLKQWTQLATLQQLEDRVSTMPDLMAQVPFVFLSSLDVKQRARSLRLILECWHVTKGKQCPRKLQLAAALGLDKGNDVFVGAGTGIGKTLAAALNQLLEDSDGVTVIVSPLKRLQGSHADDIKKLYGLETIVINDDTPRDDTYWKNNIHDLKAKKSGPVQLLLVTPEQLFRSPEGHYSRFAMLLRERQFTRRIRRFVVDESHFIHEAGLPKYGLPAFRSAYGRLDEIKIILGLQVPWLALTATAPPHMLRSIESRVLRPNYLSLHTTSNRSNIMYATHQAVGGIGNFANYECFLSKPFALAEQPRVLIFYENVSGTVQLARYLDNCLPSQHRLQGTVKHYHSSMSPGYLETVHREFTTVGGACRVLVATSAEATGIDHPDVDITCVAGLPSNLATAIQFGGRTARRVDMRGLVVFFFDAWVSDIDIDTFQHGDLNDPDRPRTAPLKPTASVRERASFGSVTLSQTHECIRQLFANYLGDLSPEALEFLTKYCCDRHNDGFKIQDHVPGDMLVEDTSGSTTKRKRTPQTKIRPPAQRKELQIRLQRWLDCAHQNDELKSVRPRYFIIRDQDIKRVARPLLGTLLSPSDITALLGESSEWHAEWAESMFHVISMFDEEVSKAEQDAKKREGRKRVKTSEKAGPKSLEFVENSDAEEVEMDIFLAREEATRARIATLR